MNQVLTDNPVIRIGVVDDHYHIFTLPFSKMLNEMGGFQTTLSATGGQELLQLLNSSPEHPDIILMDVSMPVMNGIEATRHLSVLYPEIKVIALSANDDDYSILAMIGAGACAYLRKDVHPHQLKEALFEVYRKGKYYADLYHMYEKELRKNKWKAMDISFTGRELEVIHYMSLGYNNGESARAMNISVKMVERYKGRLFEKLDTESQVVIVLEAVRRGIIKLNQEKKW
jgi:DNA-binding NarL/FixJ family response regulator